MIKELRCDADRIVSASIKGVLPDEAVKRALEQSDLTSDKAGKGKIILVATGKAAWQMANAAAGLIPVSDGIVITKYDHVMGEIPGVKCFEAGHPVPDSNGFEATAKVLDLVSGLTEDDTVVFLLSGGGSALFESPLIPGDELQDITRQLLACGADITEINTIRKRLSAVKGGKFALACQPASVYNIILSDVLGDPVDMIASGPAYPDSTTCRDAFDIVEGYGIVLSEKARELLSEETPKSLENVTTLVTGSVKELCSIAAAVCKELGYEPVVLTDQLSCEASEAGRFLGAIAKTYTGKGHKTAFIAGGETVVHLRGKGLGGRNQEIALAAAQLIDGLDAAVFSFGSDGTDGPTDAAGGYTDGETISELRKEGLDAAKALAENDSYHTLKAVGGLIMTGPTGTNVNDAAVLLING